MSLKAFSLSLFVGLCVCSLLCGGGGTRRGEEEKAEKKKKCRVRPCSPEAAVRGRSLPALLWLGRGLQLSRQQSPLSGSSGRRDSCGEAQSSGLVRKGAPFPLPWAEASLLLSPTATAAGDHGEGTRAATGRSSSPAIQDLIPLPPKGIHSREDSEKPPFEAVMSAPRASVGAASASGYEDGDGGKGELVRL